MDKFLGLIAVGALVMGAVVSILAFVRGTDIQLILGALYGLCGITALIGSVIITRMNSKP